MDLHLVTAIQDGRDDMALALLNEGASATATAPSGLTALHEAAARGQKELTLLLLRGGADPNATDPAGRTPVTLAAKGGHLHVFRLLLAAGGWSVSSQKLTTSRSKAIVQDFMSSSGLDGRMNNPCLTFKAAREGKSDVLRAMFHLASLRRMNPLFKTKKGYTALHEAAVNGQEDCAVVLIQNGADVQATTDLGVTPLMLAANAGHIGMVYVLIAAGASFRDSYVRSVEGAGRIYHYSCSIWSKHPESYRLMCEARKRRPPPDCSWAEHQRN